MLQYVDGDGTTVADPRCRHAPMSSRHGSIVGLTPKGENAQRKYRRVLATTETTWRARYGADLLDELGAPLEAVVGDGTYAASPLAPGLVPRPDDWRARIRRPETLPHYPMVLHRGGYPDGS